MIGGDSCGGGALLGDLTTSLSGLKDDPLTGRGRAELPGVPTNWFASMLGPLSCEISRLIGSTEEAADAVPCSPFQKWQYLPESMPEWL